MIGPGVTKAFRFLRDIHKDLRAVIDSADSLFAEREWYPTEDNRVSNDLSNGSACHRWLLRSIYRIYVNSQEVKTAERIIGFHVTFEPPNLYDQPVCLCLAVKFPKPTSTEEVWKKWKHEGSLRLLERLQEQSTPQQVDPSILKNGLMPQASVGTGFVVNLCDLVDDPAVARLIVEPISAAAAKL